MPKSFFRRWMPVAVVVVAAPAFVAVTLAKPQSAAVKTAEPAANRAWPTSAVADPGTVGFTKAGLEALDTAMQKSVADGDTAGMTILLMRHGQVADFKSFGKATEMTPMAGDSLFRIYSMSKPITGVAMMQLYEQGK
ncbi:MAG TPA: serine hydrolase domain-containing protein, partial [Vicinamibacterales bacterium]